MLCFLFEWLVGNLVRFPLLRRLTEGRQRWSSCWSRLRETVRLHPSCSNVSDMAWEELRGDLLVAMDGSKHGNLVSHRFGCLFSQFHGSHANIFSAAGCCGLLHLGRADCLCHRDDCCLSFCGAWCRNYPHSRGLPRALWLLLAEGSFITLGLHLLAKVAHLDAACCVGTTKRRANKVVAESTLTCRRVAQEPELKFLCTWSVSTELTAVVVSLTCSASQPLPPLGPPSAALAGGFLPPGLVEVASASSAEGSRAGPTKV